MRSLVIVGITLLVIGGGFFAYTWLQPAAAKKPVRALSNLGHVQRPEPTTHSIQGLQHGNDAWVKRYDSKTGELASQFTGDQYEPMGGGLVHVIKPKADFFSNDGRQRIRIEGVTGNVQMNEPPADKSGNAAASPDQMNADAPSRGKLQDVYVKVFQPPDAAEPTIVARMNNAAFDNDTFRISTEAFDDPVTGKHVEADEVPVIVRGTDYDFDGRGLVIKWNERDQKLQLLEVAHGESLVIKNPNALSSPGLAPSTPASATPATQPAAMMLNLHDMLASADPGAFVLLAAAKPAKGSQSAAAKRAAARRHPPLPTTAPTTRPKVVRDLSPVVYRATFERDVRIFEADKQVVAADQMDVDLLQDSSHHGSGDATTQSAGATTNPAASGAAAASGARRARRTAATLPATREGAPTVAGTTTQPQAKATTVASNATTSPATTQGIQGPIIVKWQGKLRVVPLEGKPDASLIAGKAKVHLVGNPVVLTREGSEGRCATVVYNTADASASLHNSADAPSVTLTDSQGAKVTTPQLDYLGGTGETHLANLVGPSKVEFPVGGENVGGENGGGESGGAKQSAVASWTDRCVLRLADAGEGKLAIQHADLYGGVKVDHPEMNMTADELSLGFVPAKSKPAAAATQPVVMPTTVAVAGDAPTTSPTTAPSQQNPTATLSDVVARGNVKVRMATTEKVQTIDAQNLHLETAEGPDGKRYAKHLDAEGDVVTSENGRELRAGSLQAELGPTTRPAVAATTGPTMAASTSDAALASAVDPATTAASATTRRATTKSANAFNAGGDVKLVSMLARDNVKLTTPGPDGSTASADTLTVKTKDGVEEYRLIGKPDAVVTSGKTTITGPAIRMLPDQKYAEILGAGTLRGADPNDPKQIVDIAWARGAVMNGDANRIDASDKVRVKSVSSDGTINTATSDRLIARLSPKATTQATTQAAATQATQPAVVVASNTAAAATQKSAIASKPATTKPAGSSDPGDPANFMAGKEITQTTLLGNVHIKSELLNQDGTLARGLDLLAERVDYDRITGRMDVPVQGQMLYQDHRKSADTKDGPSVGSGRGATAFGWGQSLTYDQAGKFATMTGNVQVNHEPDPGAGQKFDLRGQKLQAFFEPDPNAATKPAASTSPADSGKFRLKRLTVDDDVHVTAPRVNFDSRTLAFDPVNQILTAAGDEHSPLTLFDNETGGSTQAGDLEWNTGTDQFKIHKLTSKMHK